MEGKIEILGYSAGNIVKLFSVKTYADGSFSTSFTLTVKIDYMKIWLGKYCYETILRTFSPPSYIIDFGTVKLSPLASAAAWLGADELIDVSNPKVLAEAQKACLGLNTEAACRLAIFNYFRAKGWSWYGTVNLNKASYLLVVPADYHWGCGEVAIYTVAMARAVGMQARIVIWDNELASIRSAEVDYTNPIDEKPPIDDGHIGDDDDGDDDGDLPTSERDCHKFAEICVDHYILVSDLSYNWYSFDDFVNSHKVQSCQYVYSDFNLRYSFATSLVDYYCCPYEKYITLV